MIINYKIEYKRWHKTNWKEIETKGKWDEIRKMDKKEIRKKLQLTKR